MRELQKKIQSLRKEIQMAAQSAGRSESEIKLIAATKSQSVENIKAAFDKGIIFFGENYVQEFLKKWKILKNWTPKPSFFFIGHLQTNKVKYLIGNIQEIHTVDSLKTIEKISVEAKKQATRVPILIQVNIGEESSKAGLLPNQLVSFFKSIPKSDFVQVKGLMTIPPYHENPEKSRPYFKRMKLLFESLKSEVPRYTLSELSMGMSHDFKIAIEEGATQIRIGEGIFGLQKND